jgi:hypothetical protein
MSGNNPMPMQGKEAVATTPVGTMQVTTDSHRACLYITYTLIDSNGCSKQHITKYRAILTTQSN